MYIELPVTLPHKPDVLTDSDDFSESMKFTSVYSFHCF